MDLPLEFTKRIRDVFGENGTAWLNELPTILAEAESRWGLTLDPPFTLSYNYVAPATMYDGTKVVVKAGVPQGEMRWEIDALRHYNGGASVRLIEADVSEGIMLLERILPGTLLAELEDDDAATVIGADIMLELWRPAPQQHTFPTLAKWSQALGEVRARYDGGTGPMPVRAFALGEQRWAELLASPGEAVVLHGDVHHENILRAERRPWLAIDPHGVVGERGYETGTYLRNHLMHHADPAATLARRVDIFVERLGMDRHRIIAWGIATNVLSASWSVLSHESGWEGAIAVVELLAAMERDS